MKKKILRVVSFALTLAVLLSLLVALVPAAPAKPVSADPGVGLWSRFPTPRPGDLSGYILTAVNTTGYSVWTDGPGPVAKAIDGTIFVFWRIGEVDNIYKSMDSGRSWVRCSTATDQMAGPVRAVDIACSRSNAKLVYVADNVSVYRSEDAGASFTALAAVPLPTWHNITCMDVGWDGTTHWVVVGTANMTPGVYDGRVFVKQDPYLGPWQDQALPVGNKAYDVAAAPDFNVRPPQIVVVTDNGTHSNVWYQYSGAAWTSKAILRDNDLTYFGGLVAADVFFPSDYDSTATKIDLFVGVSTNSTVGGDVYHIYSTNAYDKNIRGVGTSTNITSVDGAGPRGTTKLLAGCYDRLDIFHSEDDGDSWRDSKYDPSGIGCCAYVLAATDYYDSGKGWAFLEGQEGAMSQTTDFGIEWYQISLINTQLQRIKDLGLSPNYAKDSTLFMVTDNVVAGLAPLSVSLWKWDGKYWIRSCDNITRTAEATLLCNIDGVRVSPKYATDSAVFIADKTGRYLWRSVDTGERFRRQTAQPAAFGGTAGADDGWIPLDSSTLLVSTGANGAYQTTNNGATWSTKYLYGATNPTSFAVSPDYDNDKTVISGDTAGNVFMSTNSGSTWTQIPTGIGITGGGTLYVEFDTGYATNKAIYAASLGTLQVHRLVVGTDTAWKQISQAAAVAWPGPNSFSAPAGLNSLVTGDGAVYVGGNSTVTATSPLVRCVNPTLPETSIRGPFFEPQVWNWLTSPSVGLWLSRATDYNMLWTLRGYSSNTTEVWQYEDYLTAGPKLTAPADKLSLGRESDVILGWGAMTSAKTYFIWVGYDADFTQSFFLPEGKWYREAHVLSPIGAYWHVVNDINSFKAVYLDPGKTYYWRICSADSLNGCVDRATGATVPGTLGRALSRWSEIRTFNTALVGAEWNPFRTSEGYPGNVAPLAGATGVPVRPTFQWNAADWAVGYEFVLADNPAYTAPIVSLTGAAAVKLPTYAMDKDLDFSKSYYWKVRAISPSTTSAWGEGVFTTMAKPVPPAPPVTVTPTPPAITVTPPPVTVTPLIPPVYMWAIIGIGAILVIAVLVLIVRTRRAV